MKEALSAFGRAFVRGFVSTLIVFGSGLGSAPDLKKLALVGVAGLIGGFVGGLRVIVGYATSLSLVTHLGSPYGDWLDSFVQGFIGSLIVTLSGVAGAPDLSTWRSIATGAIVGAFNAGIRALQGALTSGEHPAPATGVKPPPQS